MSKSDKCCSSYSDSAEETTAVLGEFVCYCNKVTEEDIKNAIFMKGATTVDEVIRLTGAMVNSNCKVNNPKGTCCYPDIVLVFNKYI